MHVNLGDPNDDMMLEIIGEVSRDCQEWNMPLLAMMYTRGEKIESEYDVKYVKHAARVGAELSADIIKVNYTGSVESFREVVEGCHKPVIIAGGEKVETDTELLTMVDGALKAGAAGVSIGRNVFQHKRPEKIVEVIVRMVHGNATVEDGLKLLKEE